MSEISGQDDDNAGAVFGLISGFIAIAIAILLGLQGFHFGMAVPPAESDASAAAVALDDEQYSDLEPVGEPIAKLYFALGDATMPPGAEVVIPQVMDALIANPESVVLISGFHDESGSAEVNAEISKYRAKAVRQALLVAGVPESRVLLRKPAVTLGGEDPAEARRVEIRVQ